MNVTTLIADLIQREGGFTDSPADSAHQKRRAKGDRWDSYCTNHGITQFTLSDVLGRQASIQDVRELTQAEAADIYRARYYDAPKIGMLPLEWQALVFDWGVNSGPATAIRELQQLCQTHGCNPGPIDGVIGPKTAAAAAQLLLVPRRWYLDRRRDFYHRRVAERPDQAVFLAGWLNRVDELAAIMKFGEMLKETA